MPAKKRIGGEGRRTVWPWSDRGRSSTTRESVIADLERLRAWLDARFREVVRL